jgi:pimeloyl-ACP methyl ester carboxylesterase
MPGTPACPETPAGHPRPASLATLATDETGEAGEGVPPLLLLHAFPLSRRMWRPQLAALAGCCRMLAPDLPGFGESPPLDRAEGLPGATAALPRICRMEDMAAAAVRLLDARGIPAAVVCGLSMGGYVALALYDGFPERVRGLVLADTRAAADDEAGRRRRLESAADVESRGPAAALADTLLPKLLSSRGDAGPGRLASDPLRAELLAWLRQEVAAASAAGVAAAQRGMAARPDRSHLLARIAVPTLVVVGEEDALTPPAESGRMRDGIAGARLVTIPGAGHLSNLERPRDFNQALREFLAGFSARPGAQG